MHIEALYLHTYASQANFGYMYMYMYRNKAQDVQFVYVETARA